MVTNREQEPLDKKDLPEGANIITSTWACKKKSNGTYHGQLNAMGFEQFEGKPFDLTSTAAIVTNDTTIRIVGTYAVGRLDGKNILCESCILEGKIEDSEEIFMEVPQDMKHHYWGLTVLRLLKLIYGLKQAALLF